MANIIIDTKNTDRENFIYSFALMSNVYEEKFNFTENQFTKFVVNMKKQLINELKEYIEFLPIFSDSSYKLSLITNCKRLLLTEEEILFITADELIKKLFVDDTNEMLARFFTTADNNAHKLDFYRNLVTKSNEIVKYCLKMDIPEHLRSLLLATLVDKEYYIKKITEFAHKALYVTRKLMHQYEYNIEKAYKSFNNQEVLNGTLLRMGAIRPNDTATVIPVLFNPLLILRKSHKNTKHILLGIDYEKVAPSICNNLPALELDTIGKIFADPTRCEIINILKSKGTFLSDLARTLNIPTNSLHYHIQLLYDAKVIIGRYEGKKYIYEINPDFFRMVSNTALSYANSN